MQYRKERQVFVLLMFLLIVVMMFMQSPKDTKKQTILSFQRGKNLICQASLGGRASVLVNRKGGWHIYKKQYFKKGDELINIAYCTLVEAGE